MSPTTETTPIPGETPLAAVVPLTDLYPSPSNPRKHFDGIDDLAASIAKKGVVLPLLVRTRDAAKGRLEIIDGERRYQAAQRAGAQFVPVILRDDLTDAEVLELQIENALQRDGLTPLEEARGFRALVRSNPSKYSAAYIADRISRRERYVVDRMRLLDLVPELQQLLDQERIGVAHAELLAKLTPEDQARALDPGGARGRTGGLWVGEEATLDFDERNEDPDRSTDPYAGLKACTVKELEAWIARHVRFDVDRMAETAPLEFARVQGQVAAAALTPGRGKKVLHITHDYHLADEVRDPAQRVYGPRSWKRADGTLGTSTDARGKTIDSPTCEHSVLGLVVIGPEYGTAFQVCIARDRCTTHWKAEIAAKKKTEKLKASGKGDEVAAQEKKARDDYASRQAREEAEKVEDRAVYARMHAPLIEALRAAVAPVAIDDALFAFLWKFHVRASQKTPVLPLEERALALVLNAIEEPSPNRYWPQGDIRDAQEVAKFFGIDGVALEKAARAAVKAEAKAAAKAKVAAEKPSKKAPAGKAAKKR